MYNGGPLKLKTVTPGAPGQPYGSTNWFSIYRDTDSGWGVQVLRAESRALVFIISPFQSISTLKPQLALAELERISPALLMFWGRRGGGREGTEKKDRAVWIRSHPT